MVSGTLFLYNLILYMIKSADCGDKSTYKY